MQAKGDFMQLGVVQMNPEFGAVKQNVDRALGIMECGEADLYVLPELFSSGYNFIDLHEVESMAEPAEGALAARMAAWAKQHHAYVVYGFIERADALYNSAALVGPDGLLGVYRKVHLFDRENLWFTPGNLGFPVFELPFAKVGIMICFDWFFPEAARTLALKGAEIIAHPANLVLPHCPAGMMTRSLENHLFTATADRIGVEERGECSLRFIGTSQIVAPNGAVLARLGTTEEALAVAEIDAALAANKSLNAHNHLLNSRRPDQYQL
jgi:predicted amidohydrolase